MNPETDDTDIRRSGYPVREGERYAKSPVTGNIYLVTKWEDRGDGRMCAIEKELVDEDEVPDGVEFDV